MQWQLGKIQISILCSYQSCHPTGRNKPCSKLHSGSWLCPRGDLSLSSAGGRADTDPTGNLWGSENRDGQRGKKLDLPSTSTPGQRKGTTGARCWGDTAASPSLAFLSFCVFFFTSFLCCFFSSFLCLCFLSFHVRVFSLSTFVFSFYFDDSLNT